MALFNDTGTAITVINGLTQTTGNLFLSLLLIILLLLLVCTVFRIPFEWTIIIMLPFLLTLWAYDAGFLAIGGITLIYLGVLFARNYLLKT